MKMKKLLLSSVVVALLGASGSLYAQNTIANKQVSVLSQAQLTEKLKQKNIPFEQITKSDYTGIYQITHEGQVAYVDDGGLYLILGDAYSLADIKKQGHELPDFEKVTKLEQSPLFYGKLMGNLVVLTSDKRAFFDANIIRLSDMTDIREELEMRVNIVDWSELPLKDAIKKVKGNGKQKIAIFSDPHCPFCKRLEKNLQELDNVTIYTFLFPIKPDAMRIAKKFWCDSNPQYAWDNFMLKGIQPKAAETCATPVERNLTLGNKLGLQGTPAIILSNGMILPGAYSAPDLQEWMNLAEKEKIQ